MTTTIPFHTTDWNGLPETAHAGESGVALWRTVHHGGLRIRWVEYSPGYRADHWCRKGHILFCLKGGLNVQLSDGRKFTLTEGMSYEVSDDMSMHRSSAPMGATLLIIDGSFLSRQPLTDRNPWKM